MQDERAKEGATTDFLQLTSFEMKLPCTEKSWPDTEKIFVLEIKYIWVFLKYFWLMKTTIKEFQTKNWTGSELDCEGV